MIAKLNDFPFEPKSCITVLVNNCFYEQLTEQLTDAVQSMTGIIPFKEVELICRENEELDFDSMLKKALMLLKE